MTISKFTAKISASTKDFMRKIEDVKRAADDLKENISLKVKVDISDAIDDIRKVNDKIKEISNDSANIEINVDTSEFNTQMDRVERRLQELKSGVNDIRIKIMADTTRFNRSLDEVIERLRSLSTNNADIDVTANINNFQRNVLRAIALSRDLNNENATVDINANNGDLLLAVYEANAALYSISDVLVQIRADNDGFFNAIRDVNRASNDLDRNGGPSNFLVRQWQRFTDATQRYANVVRAFGEVGQQVFGGVFLSLLPAIVPIISTLIGGFGGLGVMIGTVAGAATGLGVAFGTAYAAGSLLALVALPTIAPIFEEYALLNENQKRAKQSFDSLKSTYEDLVSYTEKPVLQGFTTAMGIAEQVLKELTPFIYGTAEAVSDLISIVSQKIDGTAVQSLFEFFNTQGVGIVTNLGKSFIGFSEGFINLFVAFGPLAAEMARGLDSIAQSFVEWTSKLGESERFQAFIDYVIQNTPLILQGFRDAIVGVVEFFAAFSGIGEGFIQGFADMMGAFRDWASALGENESFQNFIAYIQESTPKVLELIGNLYNFIISLASAFAPVGLVVLDVVNAFLEWSTELINTNELVKTIVGWLPVLLGLFTASVPILLLVFTQMNLVTGVFGLLSKAIQAVGPFVTKLIGWLGRLAPIFTNLATRIVPALGTALGVLSGPVGIVIAAITALISIGVALYKNWDEVSAFCSEIWGNIKDFMSNVMENIGESVSNGWEAVKNFTSEILPGVFDAVSDVFVNIVKGIGEWMVNVGTAIKEGWTASIDYLKGLGSKMFEIGKDIIKGLVKGLKEVPVIGSIIEVGGTIVEAFTNFFGIKSPSRLMASISRWIPEGVSKGITGSLGSIRVATQKMSEAAVPDFSQSVKATQSMVDQIQAITNVAARKNQEDIAKIEAEYANKRQEAQRKAAESIYEINQRAFEDDKILNPQQERQVAKIARDRNETLVELEQEKNDRISAIANGSAKDRYDALKGYLDQQINLENFTTQEIASYWQYVTTQFKDGTDERINAQIEYNKSIKNLNAEKFENEKKFIDTAVKYNKLSLTEQIKAYNIYMKQYKQGSDERIYYEEQVYDAKKKLNDEVKALSDEYLKNYQTLVQKQKDGEKEIREAQQKTFDDRKNQIAKSLGLFEEFKGTDTTELDLIGNLNTQVDALYGFIEDLQSLSARGLREGLINELQQLGVSASNEIKLLTQYTDEELQEYQNLFDIKNGLAATQTNLEMPNFAEDTEAQVQQLNQDIGKELSELKSQFEKSVYEIRFGTESEFDILNASLPEIGANAMQGLIDGIKSMESNLREQALNSAEIIRSTFASLLGDENLDSSYVQSILSGDGALNINPNINSNVSTSATYAAPNVDMPTDFNGQPIVNVEVINEWDGEQVRAYVNKENNKEERSNQYTRGW